MQFRLELAVEHGEWRGAGLKYLCDLYHKITYILDITSIFIAFLFVLCPILCVLLVQKYGFLQGLNG